MSYPKDLKDPRWQKKRLEILERDDWKCRECEDKTKSLNVHHLVYRSQYPWECENHTLITLCEDCHKVWHKKISEIESDVSKKIRVVFGTISNLNQFTFMLTGMEKMEIESIRQYILEEIKYKYVESDEANASEIVDCASYLIEETL